MFFFLNSLTILPFRYQLKKEMDKFPSYEESPMDGSKPRCPPAPERPVARHSQQVSDHTLFIYIFNLKNYRIFHCR